MTEELKRTALYDWHVANGGRMVPFAGWEMPVQYPTGPIQEHEATRNHAGLFDIDHMGQMEVRGPDAEAFVNYVVSYDVSQMKAYESHYGFFCYADGTVVDDLFVYKLPDTKAADGSFYFFIAINASNRDKDVAWVNAHKKGFNVEVKDISDETYMIAFQGPKAVAILDRLAEADLESVPRFSAVITKLNGVEAILGRTGYTGEDGFEIFVPIEQAVKVWETILKVGEAEGVKAIGLAARDSLRFEACMPLYGHELSDSITPVEAGLNFAVSYDKNFIGRDALLKQKLEKSGRISVGFELVDKGVAREHYIVAVDGKEIGVVTSGMFSPTTKKYVGMALIERGYGAKGAEIDIMIRGKAVKAKVVKKPFYIPAYRR
jgi:aminomethyltransferase